MAFVLNFPWRGPSSRRQARTYRRSFAPQLDTLEDRCVPALSLNPGGLTVHDSVTGMNWLADADLAKAMHFGVAGINPDGSMTWETAMNWVAALNRCHYLGHADWTLPVTPKNDGSATLHHDGNDFGFDFYSSDMGELYYKEFGAEDGESISFLHNKNTELFNNFQPYYYWSSTARSLPADFSFGNGFTGTDKTIDFEYAIPEFPNEPSLFMPPIPANNVVHPAHVDPNPMLRLNPDGQTVHDGGTLGTSATILSINWLANANLAKTDQFGIALVTDSDGKGQGISKDGSMNYDTAVAWVEAMNQADYLGHNNWRLPLSDSQIQDYDETDTEMGELYYTELGGQAGSTILLKQDSAANLFSNFQPYYYWSGGNVQVVTGGSDTEKDNSHETFSFGSGYRSDNVDQNEMYVLPVFDGSVLTVTTLQDDGPGSLRAAVAAAAPGDTIEFARALDGHAITLESPIVLDKLLYVVGPGADRLTIRGGNGTRLFTAEPYAAPAGESTSIYGLTLAGGRAGEGGTVLDDGAPLTLQADVFQDNQAAGGPGGGRGGALAVLGGSTNEVAVSVLQCLFAGNAAAGGAGGAGGALYCDAQESAGLRLAVAGTCFVANSATGGGAAGGALFFTSGAAANPALDVAGSAFAFNSATGGGALGGAVCVEFASAGASAVGFEGDDFFANAAVGGNGGAAAGGGLALVVDAQAGPTQVTVAQSTIDHNLARGGESGSASGGGLYMASAGGSRSDTWTLQGVDVFGNRALPGDGGAAGGASGGGIYDGFQGTLDLRQCDIAANEADDGFGGGIFIDAGAVAQATADTRICDNRADNGPDVYGTIGTL